MSSLWTIQLKNLGFIVGLGVQNICVPLSYKAEGMGKFVRACNFLGNIVRVAKRCINTYWTLHLRGNQNSMESKILARQK